MRRYFIFKIKVQDGEHTYTSINVDELTGDEDAVNNHAEKFAKEFFGDKNVETSPFGNSSYLHWGGTVGTTLQSVEEVSYTEYITLKKYI